MAEYPHAFSAAVAFVFFIAGYAWKFPWNAYLSGGRNLSFESSMAALVGLPFGIVGLFLGLLGEWIWRAVW